MTTTAIPGTRGRKSLFGVIATVLMLTSLLLSSTTASAHAGLMRADPAPDTVLQEPPSKLTAWFAEAVEPHYSGLVVLNSQGAQVDKGDSKADPADRTSMSVSLPVLPEGIYTVVWTGVSAVDGHAIKGMFVFSVRVPLTGVSAPVAEQQPPLQTVVGATVKWLSLLGLLSVIGSLAFELLVLRPVLLAGTVSETRRQVLRSLSARFSTFRWLAVGVFLIASVGHLLVHAYTIQNLSVGNIVGNPVLQVMTGTEWGHWWIWRMVLVLYMAVFLMLLRHWSIRRAGAETDGLAKAGILMALPFGLGALLTLSLVSHGSAFPNVRVGAVLSDYLHLLAAAFWIGGVIQFAMAFAVLRKQLPAGDIRATLAAIVPRFSVIAILSVGILVVTGLYDSWLDVGTLSAMTTPYGLVLAAKLVLFASLLGLGALNLLWVTKRLTSDAAAPTWLNRFVATEAVLGSLLLLTVGMLTNMQTARQTVPLSSGLSLQSTAQDKDVLLQATPGRVGPNTLTLTIKDARTGFPITDATTVTLQPIYLNTGVSTATVSAVQEGGDRYVARNVNLSVAGPWEIDVRVTRKTGFDITASFTMNVVSQSTTAQETNMPSQRDGQILLGVEMGLLAVLFVGVLLVVRQRRKHA